MLNSIEDDDVRDCEVRTNVARPWYNKTAYKSPTAGQFYPATKARTADNSSLVIR